MLKNFFRGRYGIDTLSFVLLFTAVILFKFRYIWIVGVGLLLYVLLRTFSKDINKRNQEMQKFNMLIQKLAKIFSREGMMLRKLYMLIKSKYSINKMMFQQRKQFVFFQCPKCKKNLRLPKNKGKLRVTCTVCGFEFFKKT